MNELPAQNEAKIKKKKKRNPENPPARPTIQKVVMTKVKERTIKEGTETIE